MATKKNTFTTFTPIGSVKWFKMITPDQKYNKYSMDLIVEDSEEIQKLLSKIEELEQITFDEAVENAKPQNKKKVKMSGNSSVEPEYDDEGEETGRFVIKLRQNASYKDKNGVMQKLHSPKLFDAKGVQIPASAKETLMVFNGSEAKANITLSTYFIPAVGVGVSVRPNAIQLIKLVKSNGGGDVSFDAVDCEDGFDQSFTDTTTDAPECATDDAADY